MTNAFWDARAALGLESGTRDRIAKLVEIEAIARYVKDGMAVLDVGCGDGETAIGLARRFALKMIDGCDFSANMVTAASERREYTRQQEYYGGLQTGYIGFFRHDIAEAFLPVFQGQYDLVYTERCLINLPDWETQKRAIGNIAQALKPGGLYVMLENSWDGLQAINDLRERVGLGRIDPPDHNRYLRDSEIWEFATHNDCGLEPEGVDDYSSTYYYLSRVVNAALAAQEGKEPEYDSPINKLALCLPPLAGLRGQGRIWLWRKAWTKS